MLSQVVPDRLPVDNGKRVLARANAVLQRTVRLPVERTADEARQAGDRTGRIGPEGVTELGIRETLLTVVLIKSDHGQRAHQAGQRTRVRSGGLGELGHASRTVGEQIAQPQGGGDVDRLRHLIPGHQAV